jgi:isopenicillin-N epimerase
MTLALVQDLRHLLAQKMGHDDAFSIQKYTHQHAVHGKITQNQEKPMSSLKSYFLLDPDIVFLNHGSFGACPRPVFDTYQNWQRELERQPVAFLGRQATALMANAREKLAAYLGAAADDVVYFPNPTTAINMVARSLRLHPEDEVLTTDHEYGAMDRTWRFVCQQTGARYVQQPVPLPVTTVEDFVEIFWSGVNARTKVIFLSHITSPTALTFPVQAICLRARAAGLLCIVDGAHAPGHIPLNLAAIGADIYTGACHKWLCAPKGAAFLYARPEVQHWLEPLVVSWGYQSDQPSGAQFVDYHEWQGTRDLAAFLTVPAAITFQAQHNWDAMRRQCHRLAGDTRQRLNALTGLESICPDSPPWFTQMFAARLPTHTDLEVLKRQLYDEYRIEVPVVLWNHQKFLRVSFQGYNTPEDADTLVAAVERLLQAATR